jgi:hypothetical protein
MAYRPERGWGFSDKPGEANSTAERAATLDELKRRIAEIETRLDAQAAKHAAPATEATGS